MNPRMNAAYGEAEDILRDQEQEPDDEEFHQDPEDSPPPQSPSNRTLSSLFRSNEP